MTFFDKLRPLETNDEEYLMLLEVTEEFQRQTKGSTTQKSGKATQKVIHNHIERRVNLPLSPEVNIQKIGTKMNLLFLLKRGVARDLLEYSISDIELVMKVTNNAVGKRTSDIIREKFLSFEKFNRDLKFCTVVLSEKITYPYPITQNNVFTLVAREKSACKLYLKETVITMQKNGELRKPTERGWDELQRYLTSFP